MRDQPVSIDIRVNRYGGTEILFVVGDHRPHAVPDGKGLEGRVGIVRRSPGHDVVDVTHDRVASGARTEGAPR